MSTKTELIAYTDGSYSKNKPDVYGWSFIMETTNDLKFDEYYGVGSNFIESWQIGGECEAVLKLLEYILKNSLYDKYDTINIHYDYLGIEKWAMGDWKTNKLVSKMYKKQFDKLYYQLLAKQCIVVFTKVKGHNGIEGNEVADYYARKAVDEYYK